MAYHELLTGGVDIVDCPRDCHRAFANWRNIWVSSIGKQNGRLGSVHDDLEVDVVLKSISVTWIPDSSAS